MEAYLWIAAVKRYEGQATLSANPHLPPLQPTHLAKKLIRFLASHQNQCNLMLKIRWANTDSLALLENTMMRRCVIQIGNAFLVLALSASARAQALSAPK